MLQEMQHRREQWTEALRHATDRTGEGPGTGWVSCFRTIQADKYGVGVAKVLRAQSTELDRSGVSEREEIAQKVPLKPCSPTTSHGPALLLLVHRDPGARRRSVVYETFFFGTVGRASETGSCPQAAARGTRAPRPARRGSARVGAQGAEGVPPRSTRTSSLPAPLQAQATAARTSGAADPATPSP